jgi:hypothetical protein
VKSFRATERVREGMANDVDEMLFPKVNKEQTEVGDAERQEMP